MKLALWTTKWTLNLVFSRPAQIVSSVQFSSVQDGIYALGKADNYVLHSVSQKFSQRCLWNGSNVRLTDAGHLSSFQGKSSSASSFNSSLLQAINGVLSLALMFCPLSKCNRWKMDLNRTPPRLSPVSRVTSRCKHRSKTKASYSLIPGLLAAQ